LTGAFDAEKIDELAPSVARVQSATNVYLARVIQQVETQNLSATVSTVKPQ